MPSHSRVVSGINPETKELMFPLKNIWSRLYNYYLTKDGKEIWSFFKENEPKKMQDKNGNIKLSGVNYNISRTFNFVQKTDEWKTWIINNNFQEMKKNLDDEYGNNVNSLPKYHRDEDIIYKNNFIVVKDDKIISFYHLEELAKQECERLAGLNPNQEFIYFQMKGFCKSGIIWSKF